jgi:hypothetical protein
MGASHLFKRNEWAGKVDQTTSLERRHAQRGATEVGPGATTLLFIDPDDPSRIASRSNSAWSRLLARVFAASLDDQLARGRPPESGRLLAARAHMLVSPAVRRVLAQGVDNVIRQGRRAPNARDPRAPLNHPGIVACEPDLCALRAALLTALPAPARGAAMASRLLADGAGPLFDRHRSPELRSRLREAVEYLDPSVSLSL